MQPSTDRLQIVSRSAQPSKSRGFLAFVFLMWLAIMGTTYLLTRSDDWPRTTWVVAFVSLMLVAEHRDRLFGDETSISGGLAVAAASVVAFQDQSHLLGPFLCGLVAGFYWPHIRDGAWSKIIVNGGTVAFASLAAAATYSMATSVSSVSEIQFAVAGPLMVAAYWATDSFMLAIGTRLLNGGQLGVLALELVRSDTEMLVFALAGGASGWLFLEVGTWAGVLGLCGVLLAVDLMVIGRSHRPQAVRCLRRSALIALPVVVGGATAFVAAEAFGLVAGCVVGLCVVSAAAFGWTAIALRRRRGTWAADVAFGVAVAELPAGALGVLVGMAWYTLAIGWAAATTVGLVVVGGAYRRAVFVRAQSQSIDPSRDDLAALAIVELVFADRFAAGPTGKS